MKVLWLVVAGILGATGVLAQGGSIGLFANGSATECGVDVTPSFILTVHLVHVNASVPVCGAIFRVVEPGCFGGTFLSIQGPFPETFMGTGAGGWIANYFGCGQTPIYFGTITYFTGPGASACCYFTLQPDLIYGLVTWDASFQTLPATGGTLILNPNSSCMCDVPSNETTWGRVKALYVD